MRRTALVSLALLALFADHAGAAEPVSVAVLDFTSKGGVTQEQMDALADLVATEIRRLGGCKVIGKDDIRAVLGLEQRKLMVGCADDSCMAEVGGALGVDRIAVGNVSAFGDTLLWNLKLLDVKRVLVVKAVSRQVRGDAADLLAEVRGAVAELLEVRIEPAAVDRFEIQVQAQLGDALLGGGDEGWWRRGGYSAPGVWGKGWVDLGGHAEARGLNTARAWSVGARFGVRFARYHLAFVQLDYFKEHWRGKAELDLPGGGLEVWRVGLDVDALRAVAGYRFAYPVLGWLEPFAELAVGLMAVLPAELDLDGSQSGLESLELGPALRAALLVDVGLRFLFAERFFTALSWCFDLPVGSSTTSGPALALGAHF